VLFLAGVQYIQKLKLMMGEQRQLVDNIFKQSSTSSTVPYFVGDCGVSNIRNTINLSIFFRLIMKWYFVKSIESTVAKSVDVENDVAWIFTSQ